MGLFGFTRPPRVTAAFNTRLQPAGTQKGQAVAVMSTHDASMHAQAQRVPRLANLQTRSAMPKRGGRGGRSVFGGSR